MTSGVNAWAWVALVAIFLATWIAGRIVAIFERRPDRIEASLKEFTESANRKLSDMSTRVEAVDNRLVSVENRFKR